MSSGHDPFAAIAEPSQPKDPFAAIAAKDAPVASAPVAQPSLLRRLLAWPKQPGQNTVGSDVNGVLRMGEGAATGIGKFLAPPKKIILNPVEQFKADFPNGINFNPVTQAKQDMAAAKPLAEAFKKDPNFVTGEIAGPMLLTHAVSSLLEPAGMAAKLARGTGGAAENIEPTVNDLRAISGEVSPETGKPFGHPKTVGDFVRQASAAEDKLNKEYANALGPYADRPGPVTPDGKFPVAEAIYKLKDKIGDTTPQDKAARSYIDSMASKFERPLTLDELNRQRIAANGRLFSFENKSDVAQYASAGANSGTAVDKAIANTVRDVVYPEMDNLTGKPEGYFRNLQGRVGNLFKLQSDAKEYAKSIHQKTMMERGRTFWERMNPGSTISEKGTPRFYFPHFVRAFKPDNPEAAADAAVRSAYSLRQQLQPPSEAMSVPLSALIGAENAKPKKGPGDLLRQAQ